MEEVNIKISLRLIKYFKLLIFSVWIMYYFQHVVTNEELTVFFLFFFNTIYLNNNEIQCESDLVPLLVRPCRLGFFAVGFGFGF